MKIIRTNERCYICDFGRSLEALDTHATEVAPSIYLDGLSNGPLDSIDEHTESYHYYQDDSGRYVFIDPRDGRPVCTQCNEESKATAEELELEDREYQAKTFDALIKEEIVHLSGDADLPSWNVDWDNLDRWENGNIRFPLKLKNTPRPIGWRHHTRAQHVKGTH